jgi:CBS domain-containing protein
MLLKDVCTPSVVCCGVQISVLEAARLMRHHHVGDVVVVDDPAEERIPLGVVTDRDLVIEVLGNGLDPAKTSLASLIRSPVVIAHESEDTVHVIERMRVHGVRRVPVINQEGSAVGIITLDDLLRLLVADASALLEIMTKAQTHEQHTRR